VSGPASSNAGPLEERLLALTEDLVRIPSVGLDDEAILAEIRRRVPEGWEVREPTKGALALLPPGPLDERPFVVLAGHVDTVPPAPDRPPAREGTVVRGRGAADMKGGVAVLLDLAAAPEARGGELAVGFLFVGREEMPLGHSALAPALAAEERLRRAALAIVLEPTANAIEVGCLGNLNARATVRGVAAHTARPWLGRNAIHRAIEALASVADLPVRDVEVDGLVFRESVSVTKIGGGIAANVVPDLAVAEVNLRYAPIHAPEQAEARIRELLAHPDVEVEVLSNAPGALPPLANPLVGRLRRTGGLEVRAKQAWTQVAEFAMHGVDAVNLGPGDPRYAHADDEQVDADALVRTHRVLAAFLAGRSVDEEPAR
jgi:succinyl-diaminopimelate desuccinylase